MTRLLQKASAEEPGALEELVRLVYKHLRAMARGRMKGERRGHTLSATDLVHEVYLRLFGDLEVRRFANRAHFYHAAAQAMRRLLVDHARSRKRIKRGGERRRAFLNVVDLAASENSQEILAVDEAVRRLEDEDALLGQIVRLRFFAGLSVADTAMVLGLSERTVMRQWTFARAWLYDALGEAE